MSNIARMMQRATAGAGGAGLDVDDVFSTFLYEGNGSTQTITNGIDLSGEGGLVWIKNRDDTENHGLVDTEADGLLFSNLTNAANTNVTHTFNSNGFTVGSAGSMNDSNDSHVSWTFRKAKKFFDIVTYTGNGSNRSISHNLGGTVGMLIIKRTDGSGDWYVLDVGTGKRGYLNGTYAFATANGLFFGDGSTYQAPTSTEFYLSSNGNINNNGTAYVAYLFAHNNNDGGFGPDSDQDIIKCGSYTGDGTTDGSNKITLGFEPQWIFLKRSDSSGYYSQIIDSMRGMVSGGNDQILWPNVTSAENGSLNTVDATATGFSVNDSNNSNLNGSTWIYMAIRRGPLAVPEDATKVFKVDNGDGSSVPAWSSGFPVDMAIERRVVQADNTRISSRLTGTGFMYTDTNDPEYTNQYREFDYMDGWWSQAKDSNDYSWMWKRAPGYFDVVCYDGNNANQRQIAHNLKASPEMIWVKRRNGTDSWQVFHTGLTVQSFGGSNFADTVFLNSSAAESQSLSFRDASAQTESVFTLSHGGSNTNESGKNYIAYLFATVAGVSKVGSYTGNGSSQNIDCGFSNGARFVLIKNTTRSAVWTVFDSVRGINGSGTNDPYLMLNLTNAEINSYDLIDPHSSGFTIKGANTWANQNNDNFIFYAIA